MSTNRPQVDLGEHRSHQRYPFVASVMVALKEHDEATSARFWGSSENISMGGMFVATPNVVPLGSMVTAEIYPDGVPALRLRARVVHVNNGRGFGCIFTRLSQPAEIRLVHWLGRCGGLPAVAGTIPERN